MEFVSCYFIYNMSIISYFHTASTSAVVAILYSIYLMEWKLNKIMEINQRWCHKLKVVSVILVLACLLLLLSVHVRKCSSLFRRWNIFYLALLACSSLNVKNILIEHKELITQIMKFIQWNIKQSYWCTSSKCARNARNLWKICHHEANGFMLSHN